MWCWRKIDKIKLSEEITDDQVLEGMGKKRILLNNILRRKANLSSRLLCKNLKIKIYKTILLRVVLYGCEIWPLILREECRLRVFENRILRGIFEPKRDLNGEWKRLQNEELYSFYRSPNIVRVTKSKI